MIYIPSTASSKTFISNNTFPTESWNPLFYRVVGY